MLEILQKIAKILKTIPKMDDNLGIGIMNPLKTEKQAIEMLNYLKENRHNQELTRPDRLLKKALEIGKEN